MQVTVPEFDQGKIKPAEQVKAKDLHLKYFLLPLSKKFRGAATYFNCRVHHWWIQAEAPLLLTNTFKIGKSIFAAASQALEMSYAYSEY